MASGFDVFVFEGWNIGNKRTITFHYTLRHKGRQFTFIEKITLPREHPIIEVNPVILAPFLNTILLALGVSYWKTFCPETIEIRPFTLTKPQAAFWDTVYTKGLGEFFYKNNIDFRGLVKFPHDSNPSFSIPKMGSFLNGEERDSLLLWGGGKDSIVAAETLKKAKKPFTLFSVGDSEIQSATQRVLGKKRIIIRRELDPQLLALNKKGEVYNGHVPVSAIYASLGVFAAAVFGYKEVLSSNEKSANIGNVRWLGEKINHQWSKSAEFEILFRDYLNHFVTKDISFRSLLRNKTEFQITKEFSRHKKYFPVFSSCNRNFRIAKKQKMRWCGECPKCAFVFLLLAAFLPKTEVVKIFGKNLLANKRLIPLYEELFGIRGIKPFECVGIPEEVRKAFRLVLKNPAFRGDVVPKAFTNRAIQTKSWIGKKT